MLNRRLGMSEDDVNEFKDLKKLYRIQYNGIKSFKKSRKLKV